MSRGKGNIPAQRKRRKERYVALLKANKKSCAACQTTENLTFHHVDKSTKQFNIGGRKGHNFSLEKLSQEISKCEVLCRKCHDNKHSGYHMNISRVGPAENSFTEELQWAF